MNGNAMKMAILTCWPNDKSHQWRMMPSVTRWISDVIDTLRNHTGRKIIIRPHPRNMLPAIEHEWTNVSRVSPMHIQGSYDDFDFDPSNAWAVISWSSNPGPQAVIKGIPAFNLKV